MKKRKDISDSNDATPSLQNKQSKKKSFSIKSEAIPETENIISQIKDFPIVGIGASAGGLAAFEAFFSGMPADIDPDMAFVLVQHLAPDHKSILTELVQRYTRMQVFEVKDGIKVKPNCTYIIPPNCDMAFLNGSLQLLEPSAPRGLRHPIDFFFQSLARDQHEKAIGIILSGTGSDGTLGVRTIKGEGGIVIAQSPETTKYDGMPRSAIATGLVDFELSPEKMPAQLIDYMNHVFSNTLHNINVELPNIEITLNKIFSLLSTRTGHNFSQYKTSTIKRRIYRRMAIKQIESINDYVKYLQENVAEIEALFQDMLIGVTSFFRDKEAFKKLEDKVIPKLFNNKPPDAVIRIWSLGCSTGEEAYSLAILLQEYMNKMKQNFKVQIFASDIDNQAISSARTGLYPANIASDISSERLERFFLAESGGGVYRINKSIRDMIVFSYHDVIKDPPFSKLDLISCRNLLIYMNGDLQKKIIPQFHYGLNPDGILFLGTSETIREFGYLFTILDRKLKIYQRKEFIGPMRDTVQDQFLPSISVMNSRLKPDKGKKTDSIKLPLRELTEKNLLYQVAPVGVLVNDHGDILYLHGRTGMYLEPAPGEASINNILKMAREGLKQELSKGLRKATVTKKIYRSYGLLVKTNGD